MKRTCTYLAQITIMGWIVAGAAWGQVTQEQRNVELAPMTLIGSKEAVYELPGSGYYVDSEDIRDHNALSVHRVLAPVPGVYLREEDGFGNFPNISIRGGDGTRSEKITLMEDGILTAPAPYAAPSAYYSPNISRMAGLEILKGSSQIKYGPHTTGGAINYLSTAVPEDPSVYVRGTYGEYGTFLGHGYVGDTLSGDHGRFGYLLELFHKESDGFRTIDPGIGYRGSDDTGFRMTEPMIKLFWEPNSTTQQRLEFKYGYTDLEAQETYVGVTEEDLRSRPYRRYAGTFLDEINTEHDRTYLKYIIEPSENLQLEFMGYYNEFYRNWYKIRKTGGESIHEVLARPGEFSNAFGILKLEEEGALGIRANARSYKAYGGQVSGDWTLQTGDLEHRFEFGTRVHHDEIRRRQRDDEILVGSGTPSVVRGEPGSGGNRLQEVDALAVWVQDRMTLGRLSVTPGIRFEYLELDWTDFASDSTDTPTATEAGDTSQVIPGISAQVRLSETETVFGGVYKGVSAPSPRNYLKNDVQWEESIGYEVGLRHRGDKAYGEVVGFFTDFDNLIGTAAGLGQDGATSANAGAAEVYGLEVLAGYNPLQGESVSLPLFLSATYTDATLENSLESGGGDDILSGGSPGAKLPYIPEWKLAFGAGLEHDAWGLDAVATWTSDTFGTAKNLSAPVSSSREGTIEGAWIVDVSGYIQVHPRMRLLAGVNNVLDEERITSRIPEGPRNAAPRLAYIGFELN